MNSLIPSLTQIVVALNSHSMALRAWRRVSHLREPFWEKREKLFPLFFVKNFF
jgi:predicted DNA-binding ribbon-helix-helix protein